jgi:hypothetical protein
MEAFVCRALPYAPRTRAGCAMGRHSERRARGGCPTPAQVRAVSVTEKELGRVKKEGRR